MQPARLVGLGAFVLSGLLLFAIGIFMIGERRMLFTRTFTLFTEFSSIGGLEPGAPVRVAGMAAGEVQAIQAPPGPAGKFRIELEVREDLHQLVRSDSVASIRTEGLVGGRYLHVGVGSEQAPPAAEGSTIAGQEPFEIADLLQQASGTVAIVNETITTLRGDLEETIRIAAGAAEGANRFVDEVGAEVREIAQAGNRIASDTQAVVQGVREGRGTLGRFVTDDQVYRRAVDIANEAQQTVENLRAATEQARRVLEDFKGDAGAAGITASLRETIESARVAMATLAEDAEALKHNWFFSGYFRRRGYFSLADLSPQEYRQGVLEQGNRVPLRIWLNAAVLFSPEAETSAGPGLPAATLNDGGRARLDSAMVPFMEYRGAAPFVIEGYATGGSAADRITRSRQYASTVRTYLISRFDLVPSSIAVMPLGSDAEGSPSGSTWDGVALATFVEKRVLDAR